MLTSWTKLSSHGQDGTGYGCGAKENMVVVFSFFHFVCAISSVFLGVSLGGGGIELFKGTYILLDVVTL